MFCHSHHFRARMMRRRHERGWDGFGGSAQRSGGGWGRQRVLDHGDLRLLILQLIAEKPSHGYEIIKAIEDRFAGTYSPSPGVVYPTLTLLEEQGFVRQENSEGAKKLYAATDEGRRHLEANRDTLDRLRARLDELGEALGGGPSPPVLRAIMNLRTALRMRLGRPVSAEQARAIVAALDAATVQIERE